MSRLFAGYILFGLMGASVGYIIATAYLDWRIGPHVDYLYILTNSGELRDVWPQQSTHVLLIIAGTTLLCMALATKVMTERLTEFGKTHWQSKFELKRNGFFQKPGVGFLLAKTSRPKGRGKFLSSNTYPHCMVVAPTGRGKGVGFVIPNLLTFRGSTVVLDVKSENYEKTARRRSAMQDKVIRFAPTDFEAASHRYNPLKRIAAMSNQDQQMFELTKLAELFFVSDNEKNDGLLKGGIQAFVAVGMLAIEQGKPTLGQIHKMLNSGSGTHQENLLAYAAETNIEAVRIALEGLAKNESKTLSNFMSMLETSGFSPWANEHVCNMTAESDFDFADIRRQASSIEHRASSIYFTIRNEDIKPVAGLVRLFFSDLIASLQHHEPGPDEPWPVMIILDEFHKLGRMPIVADSITTLRSYGGHLAIITQTVPMLDELYGQNLRRSLEGGSGIKVYMTPSEELTIKNLSEACGKTTKRAVSKSRQSGIFEKTTISERTDEVPLLPEDEARRLSKDDIILVVDGDHPVRAKAIRYYEDPFLKPIYEGQNGEYPTPAQRHMVEDSLAMKAQISRLSRKVDEISLDNSVKDNTVPVINGETPDDAIAKIIDGFNDAIRDQSKMIIKGLKDHRAKEKIQSKHQVLGSEKDKQNQHRKIKKPLGDDKISDLDLKDVG